VVEPSGRAAAAEMLAALVLLVSLSVGPFFTHLAGLVYLVCSALLGGLFIAAGVVVLLRNDRRAARLVLRASVVYLPVLFGVMVATAPH
jgi:protoheme IX farnesyltransferase